MFFFFFFVVIVLFVYLICDYILFYIISFFHP